jgi:hypothetical protein
MLLALFGFGLALGNWAGLFAMLVLPAAAFALRIASRSRRRRCQLWAGPMPAICVAPGDEAVSKNRALPVDRCAWSIGSRGRGGEKLALRLSWTLDSFRTGALIWRSVRGCRALGVALAAVARQRLMRPSGSPRYLTITVSDADPAVLDARKFVTGSTSRKQVLLAGVYALARAAHRRDEILTIAAARRPYIASIDIIGKNIGALPGLDPSSV